MRDLKRDLEICEAATPGPWERINGTDVFTKPGAVNGEGIRADGNDGWHIADCGLDSPTTVKGEDFELSRSEQWANAQFIAEAREGWPYAIRLAMDLKERVKELEERVKELEAQRDALAKERDALMETANEWFLERVRLQERMKKMQRAFAKLQDACIELSRDGLE